MLAGLQLGGDGAQGLALGELGWEAEEGQEPRTFQAGWPSGLPSPCTWARINTEISMSPSLTLLPILLTSFQDTLAFSSSLSVASDPVPYHHPSRKGQDQEPH